MNSKIINSIIVLIILYLIFVLYAKLTENHNCFCIKLKISILIGIISLVYLLYHTKYVCHEIHEPIMFDKDTKIIILLLILSLLFLFVQRISHNIIG